MFWIKDKEAFVATEEFGQDLEHVEVLQRKFEEFQKDMASQVNKDFFSFKNLPKDLPRILKRIFIEFPKNSQRISR
jgi:flagellar motor switch protein FliG